MNDEAIVRLFMERDEAAIRYTKEKYGQRLTRLAYDITRDAQAAEECENDTYQLAWNSIPPHEPYHYFYAFLAHMTRHAALNCCRGRNTQKRKASVEELTAELENTIPGQSSIEDAIDDAVLKELLNRFLSSLPQEKRNVFIRRYWYMDSVEQIAQGYGMSSGKVKSVLFRCRKQLKELLEKEGYAL